MRVLTKCSNEKTKEIKINVQNLKLSTWVVGDKLENFDSFNDLSIHVGSGTLVYKTIYDNWRSKLEIPKNREVEKLKKNKERKRKGEEDEAEAGGETAIDQMEVAGDMEVTGDVMVSGCDNKN